MTIIEQLKANEKPFGLMSEEMQAKAGDVGRDDFEVYYACGTAPWSTGNDAGFDHRFTYRLRPDYDSKTEIVEYPVKLGTDGMLEYHVGTGIRGLVDAPDYPDFIGFKYEDGRMYPFARLYKNSNGGRIKCLSGLSKLGEDGYEVLTPTHVCFQVTK